MAEHLSRGDIKTAVKRTAKQFTGSKDTMLDHLVNMVYLGEIMSSEGLCPYFWLMQQNITRRCVAPSVITGITAANPGVFTTSAAHGLVAGDIIEIADVVGMTECNGVLAQVATVPSTTTLTTNLNTANYTAYTSGGRLIHRGITLDHKADDVLYASWNNESTAMVQLKADEMEQNTALHNVGTIGVPQRFTFGMGFGNDGAELDQIIWNCGADGNYLLRYWYRQRISRLSSDTDVPLLPPQFHDVIVAGVVARLTESKENVGIEKASLWPTIYTGGLEAIKTYNERYWQHVDRQQIVKPYLM